MASFEIAGNGYINVGSSRGEYAEGLLGKQGREAQHAANAEKIVVEHTNINPNKAAHIGHLRNAILGDTFVRMLRTRGRNVEVQNYIDNTGVQVADVVVGFHYLEKKMLADVRALIADPNALRLSVLGSVCANVVILSETIPKRSNGASIRCMPLRRTRGIWPRWGILSRMRL